MWGTWGIILHIIWKFPLTAEGRKSPLKPLEVLAACRENPSHSLFPLSHKQLCDWIGWKQLYMPRLNFLFDHIRLFPMHSLTLYMWIQRFHKGMFLRQRSPIESFACHRTIFLIKMTMINLSITLISHQLMQNSTQDFTITRKVCGIRNDTHLNWIQKRSYHLRSSCIYTWGTGAYEENQFVLYVVATTSDMWPSEGATSRMSCPQEICSILVTQDCGFLWEANLSHIWSLFTFPSAFSLSQRYCLFQTILPYDVPEAGQPQFHHFCFKT